MEPDFKSTPEALVAGVKLRSITSSQVLARPSEWLELLRRYGNVAPFFCAPSMRNSLVLRHNKVCSEPKLPVQEQQSLLVLSKRVVQCISAIDRRYRSVVVQPASVVGGDEVPNEEGDGEGLGHSNPAAGTD